MVFAAVVSELAERGSVSIQAVRDRAGVSIGSLYNRYGSREGLLARTWLDAVERFQAEFLDALGQSADAAILATPRFCRTDRDRAIVLACCRRSEFLAGGVPSDLRERIATVNDAATRAVRSFARAERLTIATVQLALVSLPLGAVRQYLPARHVPAALDDEVLAACRAVLALARRRAANR